MRSLLATFLIISAFAIDSGGLCAPKAFATVDAALIIRPDRVLCPLQSTLFGINVHPVADKPLMSRPEFIRAVRSLGIKSCRFPNGCVADIYNWREPRRGWATVDEFLDFCDAVGAEPYYTLNLQGGTEGLEGPVPKDVSLEERIKYKHTAPNPCGNTDYTFDTLKDTLDFLRNYTIDRALAGKRPVLHYEMGNENWGQARTDWPPEIYSRTVEVYAKAMRAVLEEAKKNHPQLEKLNLYIVAVGYPVMGNNMKLADTPDRDINIRWTRELNRLYSENIIDAVQEHFYPYASANGGSLAWVVHNLHNIIYARKGLANERLNGYRDPEIAYNMPMEHTEWNIKCWGSRFLEDVQLTNPGFEEGSGPSPRTVIGWTCTGMDIKASDGSWFWGVPPYSGSWLCEAATNGSSCDGVIYQTVDAVPGFDYKFTAAVSSWMRENDTWKYDVWHQQGRLDYMRVGIDPYGGNDPNSPNVRWTPRFYSHLRYNIAGIHAIAQSNKISVFVSFGGLGGQWHLFGIDDCRLSTDITYTPYDLTTLKAQQPDGTNAEVSNLVITAVPSEAGAYYAETTDRSCGIKIVSNDTAAVGQKVTVRGTLRTDSLTKERYIDAASFTSKTSSTEPKPLNMLCKNIGGAAYGLIPAVPNSSGPHNTGLAIRIAAKVTVKGTNYVFVNDGSLPSYGVKVDMSHISPTLIPNVGQTVGLSGISSLYYAAGIRPLLIVRRAGDVRVY